MWSVPSGQRETSTFWDQPLCGSSTFLYPSFKIADPLCFFLASLEHFFFFKQVKSEGSTLNMKQLWLDSLWIMHANMSTLSSCQPTALGSDLSTQSLMSKSSEWIEWLSSHPHFSAISQGFVCECKTFFFKTLLNNWHFKKHYRKHSIFSGLQKLYHLAGYCLEMDGIFGPHKSHRSCFVWSLIANLHTLVSFRCKWVISWWQLKDQ